MTKVALEPYLFFNGNAREAMEFYKSIFGGELTIQTLAEAMPDAKEHRDKIMHARLEGDVTLMASDDMGVIPKESARISLSLMGSDETKLRGYFDKLAEGGQATHPIEKQFWGDIYGDLRDKYGISWMVNINASKED